MKRKINLTKEPKKNNHKNGNQNFLKKTTYHKLDERILLKTNQNDTKDPRKENKKSIE
jgi:hypothetical protein